MERVEDVIPVFAHFYTRRNPFFEGHIDVRWTSFSLCFLAGEWSNDSPCWLLSLIKWQCCLPAQCLLSTGVYRSMSLHSLTGANVPLFLHTSFCGSLIRFFVFVFFYLLHRLYVSPKKQVADPGHESPLKWCRQALDQRSPETELACRTLMSRLDQSKQP